MKLYVAVGCAVVAIFLSLGCRSDGQNSSPVLKESKAVVADDVSDDSNDLENEAKVTNCKRKSCKSMKVTIAMINEATGGKLSNFIGETNTDNRLVFKGSVGDQREVGLRIDEAPYNGEVETNDDAIVLVLNTSEVTSGSVDVVARDISRCLAYENNDETCRDMELDDYKKYEFQSTFSYQIKVDADTKAAADAKKAADEAKDAKCKNGILTAGVGVLVGAIGTSTTTTNKGADGKTTKTTSQTTNNGQIVNSAANGITSCI